MYMSDQCSESYWKELGPIANIYKMASMNYFNSGMYNSTNTVEYFDGKDN
jgi:hypothetical protein